MRVFARPLLVALIVSSSAVAEMSFKASVDKLQAAYEEKIQLQLEVTVSDPTTKTTPIPPPEIIGFRIGGSGSSVERRGDQIVRRYLYELVPARSGQVTVPSFKVEFQGALSVDTLVSEPITVEIAKPKPVSKPFSYGIFILIGVAVVLAGGALYTWKRAKSRPAVEAEPDWRDDYRSKFAEVQNFAEREDFRNFSKEITRLVVSILERVHEARLVGFTSVDLLRWLEERSIDKEVIGLCRDLFAFCESVKFSTGKVDVQEGKRAQGNAERIVELLLK